MLGVRLPKISEGSQGFLGPKEDPRGPVRLRGQGSEGDEGVGEGEGSKGMRGQGEPRRTRSLSLTEALRLLKTSEGSLRPQGARETGAEGE